MAEQKEALGAMQLPEGNVSEGVRALWTLAKTLSSDDVSLDKLAEIQAKHGDGLYKPDEEGATAIEAAFKHVLADSEEAKAAGEKLLKGFVAVFHNAQGKEQVRLLLVTQAAFYRVKFDFEKKEVVHFERLPLFNVQIVEFGPFKMSNTVGMGGKMLQGHLTRLWGLRVHQKDRPDKPKPFPYLVEEFLDKCMRTYRREMDEDQLEKALDEKAEDHEALKTQVTDLLVAFALELVFTMMIAQRLDAKFKEDNGLYLVPCSGPKDIEVFTNRGLTAVVAKKLGHHLRHGSTKDGEVEEEVAEAEKEEEEKPAAE